MKRVLLGANVGLKSLIEPLARSREAEVVGGTVISSKYFGLREKENDLKLIVQACRIGALTLMYLTTLTEIPKYGGRDAGQERDQLHLESRNERERRVLFSLQMSFANDTALRKLCGADVTNARSRS